MSVTMSLRKKKNQVYQVRIERFRKKDVNQRIFLGAEESIKRLVEVAEHHGSNVTVKKHLKVKKYTRKATLLPHIFSVISKMTTVFFGHLLRIYQIRNT